MVTLDPNKKRVCVWGGFIGTARRAGLVSLWTDLSTEDDQQTAIHELGNTKK